MCVCVLTWQSSILNSLPNLFLLAIATIADVRTSLLDSKQPQANGGTDLSHDMVANRDSYLAFPGGFDNGVSEDTVPDLMR